MPIHFHCCQCQAAIATPDGAQGHNVRCPHCGTVQRIPEPAAGPPAVSAPAPDSQPAALAAAPIPPDPQQISVDPQGRQIVAPPPAAPENAAMVTPQELSNNKSVVRVVASAGAVLGIVVLSLLALLVWGLNRFHPHLGAPGATQAQLLTSPPVSGGVGDAPAPGPVGPPKQPAAPPVAHTPTPPTNRRVPDRSGDRASVAPRDASAPPVVTAPAPGPAIVPDTTLPGVLQGRWRCTTTRGVLTPTRYEIRSLGGGRIRLQPGSMRGIYELRGEDLVMVEPDDRRFAQIVLHVNSPDEITVTQGKSYPSAGQDYQGMRFTRLTDPGVAPVP